MKAGEKIDLGAKLVLYLFGFLAIKKIAEKFGVIESAEDKKIKFDINKAYNNEAFNTDFRVLLQKLALNPKFRGMTTAQVVDQQTNRVKVAQIAVEIYAAGFGAGTNETVIFSQLRRLSNILELGLLNTVFLQVYKVSIIDFLADELSDSDLSKVSIIINNLPEYSN